MDYANEAVEFNLLAVIKDRVLTFRQEQEEQAALASAIRARLTVLCPGWEVNLVWSFNLDAFS